MIAPTDPVPPLPRLVHGQPVRVVDVKRRDLFRLDGLHGRILWPAHARDRGKPPQFAPNRGWATYSIDTPRHRGELIVEPLP